MSTKEMLKKYLVDNEVFDNSYIHPLVNRAVQCITGDTIPYRLKLSIAVSELVTLTSHLRKNIELHDKTLVPCNAIVFGLAGSGVSKDSSLNQVRKALDVSYEKLETYRRELAKHNAEQAAILDGKEPSEWQQYYVKPRELASGLGTVEGLVQHFSELETGEVGSGSLQSSEIGQELLSNSNMADIIKTISIAYDLGKIPAKVIKSNDNQTCSIRCLPISALFFGSQDAILYDNTVKAKFKMAFNTQLARRSIFSFTPEVIKPRQFSSPEELFEFREKERANTVEAQATLRVALSDIVDTTTQEPLVISKEAQMLFDVYKEYNSLEADDLSAQYPITKLARRHQQWKALKLSGNYAILDGSTIIEAKHYVMAINTIEIFAEDLASFERELVKEPYEIFSEFCQYNADNGEYKISLHQLRKLGYIPMSGNPEAKMKELVHLASSYDKTGVYTVCPEGICYEQLADTSVCGVSFLIF